MYDILSMKSIAQELNNRTFTDYYYRLMLLARSVYKWKNLPNGIDEKWIERYLFTQGRCVFLHDKEKGFMVAKCVESGGLNYYDEPAMVQGIGTNYTGEILSTDDAIIIRNNDDMVPTAPTIQLFALRLAEISRTIDVNVNAQKMSTIIQCSERQRLTLKNIMKQWNGYEPLIFGDKDIDIDSSIKTLKIDAPVVFDKLQYQKHSVWNECMTFLGINNANQDKKERLVDDEVQANNEQVEMSAHIMLKARKRACELINKRYGLNISVELRKPDTAILEAHMGITEGNHSEAPKEEGKEE